MWNEVLSGDNAAWAELVRRYQPLVYAVSTRAGLSPADAADCFQQTWVSLYENRTRLKNPSRLSAWLVTTAKREAMRLRIRSERSAPGSGQSSAADGNPLPDQALVALERRMHLDIAMKEVGGRCRQLLNLFFYAPEKLSYAAIASAMGMSSNSLGALRRRCLQRLRQILAKKGLMDARNDEPSAL